MDSIHITEYFLLLAQLDLEINRLGRLYGSLLKCRPGCSSCCMELSLLPVEAEAVRRACRSLDAERQRYISRQAADEDGCPFLHQRHCLIHAHRPVICRTHGLPVAYVDLEREVIEVSACPVNFKPEHRFDQEGLLFLDPYNEKLQRLNHRWSGGAAPLKPDRIRMRHLVSAPGPAKPDCNSLLGIRQ